MRFVKSTLIVIGAAATWLAIIGSLKKTDSIYGNNPSEKNPMEGKKVWFIENPDEKENADGVRGHLEAVGDSERIPSFYEKYVKRCLDIVLSFGGLVILSPLFLGIAAAIIVDDPGPVLFTQKRIGKNKQYFKLHKFRSMKMSTPHDKPTHMLDNPEQYITRVGKFIRTHSLDELPQIWDIFIGNMSVIGPRPGLWNQDLLTADRDKYGANDIRPGLTGLAQASGRNLVDWDKRFELDAQYVEGLSFMMDLKVIFMTIKTVLWHSDQVSEDTGQTEGNFAKIRQERLDRIGRLKEEE